MPRERWRDCAFMFSQAFRPGINCGAPRRRSRDAESAPTELIVVAEVALLFGWIRQKTGSETKMPATKDWGHGRRRELGRDLRPAFVFVAACCLEHRQECLCY